MNSSTTGCCFPFPFRACLECIQGPSLTATQSYSHLREDFARFVKLDRNHTGQEVVLLKEDMRICGTGGALGNVPLLQNKSYFQVYIQQTGSWAVGLATRKTNLSKSPNSAGGTWVLMDDGSIFMNGEFIEKLDLTIAEGDTIGIGFDHVELSFYKGGNVLIWNGTPKPAGQVFYPFIFVDDSAILDVRFNSDTFSPKAPSGFQEIIAEQTLL